MVPGTWYSRLNSYLWYPRIPAVWSHVVPRGYHHVTKYMSCLALWPSCSTTSARTGEHWHCSSSYASGGNSRSRTLPAVALFVCVLKWPLRARLGCPVLTRRRIVVGPCHQRYCCTAPRNYLYSTETADVRVCDCMRIRKAQRASGGARVHRSPRKEWHT